MQNDVVRDRQFNMRMSDAEWSRLSRIALYYGVSAPDVMRRLLEKEEEAIGLNKPRMTEFHRDVLRALGRESLQTMKLTTQLIDPVSRHHSHPYLGNEIYRALTDLFHLRYVEDLGAGRWKITEEGLEALKGK